MDLNKAQKKIRNAWITGSVMSGFLFLEVLNLYSSGKHLVEILLFLVCFFITSGLSFGIYKRSRICVIAMFILLVTLLASMLHNMRQHALASYVPLPDKWMGIVLVFVVLYVIFEGIRGTFTYHKLKPIRKNENIESNTNFT